MTWKRSVNDADEPSTVSDWIAAIRGGNDAAATKLWQRYSRRLRWLAHRWLQRMPNVGIVDGDDIASGVFYSFIRASHQGQFHDLANRDELWALLAIITQRKACDANDSAQSMKRGGDFTQQPAEMLEKVTAQGTPPDLVVEMVEEFRRLMDDLDDPDMEQLVLLKLEGYTHEEIANQLALSRSSIQRMFRIIRSRWMHLIDES